MAMLEKSVENMEIMMCARGKGLEVCQEARNVYRYCCHRVQ